MKRIIYLVILIMLVAVGYSYDGSQACFDYNKKYTIKYKIGEKDVASLKSVFFIEVLSGIKNVDFICFSKKPYSFGKTAKLPNASYYYIPANNIILIHEYP